MSCKFFMSNKLSKFLMLSRIAQIYSNHDQLALENIANDIADAARNSSNQLRKKHIITLESSSNQTSVDTAIFLAFSISKPRPVVFWREALSYVIPLIYRESNEILYRTLIMNIFSKIDFVDHLGKLFKYMGVNHKLVPFSIAAAFAGYQVLSLRLTHGFHSKSIVDFATSTLAIAGIHTASIAAARYAHSKVPFLLPSIICYPISYSTNFIVQRIGIYGVPNAWKHLTETAIAYYIKYKSPSSVRPQIPLDVDIPTQLQCAICRDLLYDPVESLGFFFCHSCLTEWVNRAHTHPVTGEPLSAENINRSLEMNAVVGEYIKTINNLIQQNNGENHGEEHNEENHEEEHNNQEHPEFNNYENHEENDNIVQNHDEIPEEYHQEEQVTENHDEIREENHKEEQIAENHQETPEETHPEAQTTENHEENHQVEQIVENHEENQKEETH